MGAGRSLFEPWSAETGWAGTDVADAGVSEPGEPEAWPGVAGSGGSRASTSEPGSAERAGLGADGFDGQGETGLDFGAWANGPAPDGGAAGFAQPGWPAGAEPDSPVARASWLDADSPASPGADAGVNLFSPDAGPAAGQEADSGAGLFGADGLPSAGPGTGASAGLFPADAGPSAGHDTDSGGDLIPDGARYPAGPEAGNGASLFRPDAAPAGDGAAGRSPPRRLRTGAATGLTPGMVRGRGGTSSPGGSSLLPTASGTDRARRGLLRHPPPRVALPPVSLPLVSLPRAGRESRERRSSTQAQD